MKPDPLLTFFVLLVGLILAPFAIVTFFEVVLLWKKEWLDRKRTLWLLVTNGVAAVLSLILTFAVGVTSVFSLLAIAVAFDASKIEESTADLYSVGLGAISLIGWFGVPLLLFALIRGIGFRLFKGKNAAITWKYNILPIIVLEVAVAISLALSVVGLHVLR